MIDPLKESLDILGVDAFIDCSGATPAIKPRTKAVRPAGCVVPVGMGADELPIPFPKLYTREIWLTGVFRYTGTWPILISKVARRHVDLTSMVTARYDVASVQDALEATRDPHSIKPLVTL